MIKVKMQLNLCFLIFKSYVMMVLQKLDKLHLKLYLKLKMLWEIIFLLLCKRNSEKHLILSENNNLKNNKKIK
jgi:hypothetical protein